MSSAKFLLGIDLGTTSVKVALLDAETRCVADEVTAPHYAELESLPPHHHEQAPDAILDALREVMAQLKESCQEKMGQVVAIGVCGQMHGCMMWKNDGWKSSLITWMDGRGTKEFLTSLPSTDKSNVLHSGYGTVSLAWLSRNGLVPPAGETRTGTIMDFLVCQLAGLAAPVMTHMLAESWGYFDRAALAWDAAVGEIIPEGLLPKVVEAGTEAGRLKEAYFGVPEGTPVLAAVGDFQANIYAAEKDGAAILNIGTSSQLSYEMPSGFKPPLISDFPKNPIQYFPFFEDRYIGIAASLNGGNVLHAFLNCFKSWSQALAPEAPLPSDEVLWERMEALVESFAETPSPFAPPVATPLLFGERHSPSASFAIRGLSERNAASLGSLLAALVRGLVENLFSMISPELLEYSGVKEIVVTGLAGRPWVMSVVEHVAGSDKFIFTKAAKKLDSAYGVALIAGKYLVAKK